VQKEGLASAVDLGCGTGELTHHLFEALELRSLLGVDSSPEMLERAERWVRPGLSFRLADIANFRPDAPLDLVFSNAALHWLPEHELLVPRLLGWVRPGGQVALQMPFNFDHCSHRVAHETALRLFPDTFAGESGPATLPVERYAEILFANGFEQQICRIEVYGHPMPSGREVVEWTRGTLLTAYRARLTDDDFTRFVEAYRDELLSRIGEGPYFYAFKRMLVWGRKS
jgi:trans-aconitate 2-methyltransferase